MTLPVFQAAGSFTQATTAPTITLPSGVTAGDLLILCVETANQTLTTPSGWTSAGLGAGQGTAGAAGGVRLYVFWKLAGASEGSVTLADSGDHTGGIIYRVTGADTVWPFHKQAESLPTSATSQSFPAVTTTLADCLILNVGAIDNDAASTTNASGWTNASLGSVTERSDNSSTSGAGGGIIAATGTKATAGASGSTAVTLSTAQVAHFATFAIAPPAIPTGADGSASGAASFLSVSDVELIPSALSGDWTLTGGTVNATSDGTGLHWSAADNLASCVKSGIGLADNTTYQVKYTISSYTSGALRSIVYGATTAHAMSSASRSATGTYTDFLTTSNAGSFTNQLRLQATGSNGTNTFDVNFASVKIVSTTGAQATTIVAATGSCDCAVTIDGQATDAGTSSPPDFDLTGTLTTATTGTCSPPWPAGYAVGDYAILVVESADDAVPTLSTPGAFTLLGQSTFNSDSTLTVYGCVVDSTSMTRPVLEARTDHQVAAIFTFTGVYSADPIEAVAVRQLDSSPVSTTTGAALTTATGNCLIVDVVSHDADILGGTFTSEANTSTTNVTERYDQSTQAGNGGGFGIVTSVKATAGSVSATTLTVTTGANTKRTAAVTFALRPSSYNPAGSVVESTGSCSGVAAIATATNAIWDGVGSVTGAASLASVTSKIVGTTSAVTGVASLSSVTGKTAGTTNSVTGVASISSATNAIWDSVGSVTGSATLSGATSNYHLVTGSVTGVATPTGVSSVVKGTANAITASASLAGVSGAVAATANSITGVASLSSAASALWDSVGSVTASATPTCVSGAVKGTTNSVACASSLSGAISAVFNSLGSVTGVATADAPLGFLFARSVAIDCSATVNPLIAAIAQADSSVAGATTMDGGGAFLYQGEGSCDSLSDCFADAGSIWIAIGLAEGLAEVIPDIAAFGVIDADGFCEGLSDVVVPFCALAPTESMIAGLATADGPGYAVMNTECFITATSTVTVFLQQFGVADGQVIGLSMVVGRGSSPQQIEQMARFLLFF